MPATSYPETIEKQRGDFVIVHPDGRAEIVDTSVVNPNVRSYPEAAEKAGIAAEKALSGEGRVVQAVVAARLDDAGRREFRGVRPLGADAARALQALRQVRLPGQEEPPVRGTSSR